MPRAMIRTIGPAAASMLAPTTTFRARTNGARHLRLPHTGRGNLTDDVIPSRRRRVRWRRRMRRCFLRDADCRDCRCRESDARRDSDLRYRTCRSRWSTSARHYSTGPAGLDDKPRRPARGYFRQRRTTSQCRRCGPGPRYRESTASAPRRHGPSSPTTPGQAHDRLRRGKALLHCRRTRA